MSRPPDRLLSSVDAARNRTALRAAGDRSNLGDTARARARTAALGALRLARLFAIVEHGDDGTVERPFVLLVLWVGAATPANGVDYDFWYPATL